MIREFAVHSKGKSAMIEIVTDTITIPYFVSRFECVMDEEGNIDIGELDCENFPIRIRNEFIESISIDSDDNICEIILCNINETILHIEIY